MSEIQASSPAPVAERDNTKLAMWVFLGGEVVFFVSLILLIIFTRLTNNDYETAIRAHLNIPVIALNTFVLVTSSYFVVRALEAITLKDNRKAVRNNLIGVVSGYRVDLVVRRRCRPGKHIRVGVLYRYRYSRNACFCRYLVGAVLIGRAQSHAVYPEKPLGD